MILHDLCGLLMRFRLHNVLVDDTEKVFLKISLQLKKRDLTKFLWIRGFKNPTVNHQNIQEYRFPRAPFGVISSPFLFGATAGFHYDTYLLQKSVRTFCIWTFCVPEQIVMRKLLSNRSHPKILFMNLQ